VRQSRKCRGHTSGFERRRHKPRYQLQGADCVVNAAGVAEAASLDEGLLTAANGIVPGYLAMFPATWRWPLPLLTFRGLST
jgi:hypothetical protein